MLRKRRTFKEIKSWSHSDYELAKRKQLAVKEGLLFVKTQRAAGLDENSSQEDYELVRQLEIEIAKVNEILDRIEDIPRQGCTWWDRVKLRLYDWSTRGRFIEE